MMKIIQNVYFNLLQGNWLFYIDHRLGTVSYSIELHPSKAFLMKISQLSDQNKLLHLLHLIYMKKQYRLLLFSYLSWVIKETLPARKIWAILSEASSVFMKNIFPSNDNSKRESEYDVIYNSSLHFHANIIHTSPLIQTKYLPPTFHLSPHWSETLPPQSI